ncbi:hypothetical protein KKG83_00840 [Candidatus Micrarchaeota archaeon]|nr:hypothetical protein [Candidatus Micrarchaeota archaeon]MBU2475997.1 hypothetical protein [Candidatus Micrarchaeota archaeon]
MLQKFYLDTAIRRDYFEDRKDGIRPLGEFAFQFLKTCQKNKCKVLFSDLVVEELKSDYSDERISELFLPFEDVLVKVFLSDEQISESRKISSSVKETHFKDALHAVLARDNKAVMITRDRHFEALTGVVEIAMPEDIHF